ncbi:MAG: DUF255 domain-containing protein [Fimbriimonadaceae bacterium]
MIRTDQRIRYSSVALTITSLAVVFATAAFLRQYIGPPEEGRLGSHPAGFIRRAARDRVDWRTLADDPFREAQRLDRILLIVAGSERSELARQFDRRILSLAEVVERMNREFVPVRIDLDQDPQWAYAFLPLSTAKLNADEGWYAVCLDPSGSVLTWMSRSSPDERIVEAELLEFLREARAKRALPLGEESSAELARKAESAAVSPRRLQSRPAAGIPTRDYAELLTQKLDPVFGGFRTEKSRRVWPWEWRFLAQSRDYRALAAGLEPLTRGPMMDWTGPGAFRLSTDPAGRSPSLARDAVCDADCAALFAMWAVNGGGNWARQLALEFVSGIRETYVVGPKVYGSTWRSPYNTSSGLNLLVDKRALRRTFTPLERDWLRDNMALPSPSNPANVPVAVSPSSLLTDRDRFFAMVERVGRASPLPAERGGHGYLDALASVGARLLEVGRLLDDHEARGLGLEFFAMASAYRAGPDDVVRSFVPGGAVRRTAFEYAAYTDIALEAYFTTAEPAALEEASKVFDRLLDIFYDERSGTLRSMPDGKAPQEFEPGQASIADGDRSSLVGTVLRCVWRLSCAWRGTPRGERYLALAGSLSEGYGPAASRLDFRVGSLESARQEVARDEFVWVSGPRALAAARQVSPSLEGALVVPAGRPGVAPVPGPGVWRVTGGAPPARLEGLSASP